MVGAQVGSMPPMPGGSVRRRASREEAVGEAAVLGPDPARSGCRQALVFSEPVWRPFLVLVCRSVVVRHSQPEERQRAAPSCPASRRYE